ncbi:MAG: hypothetical protein RMI90_15055 [Thermoguttaceae bacterium]|nr:hypothetical protein [Thermoguttaceae bacterium]
MVRIWRSLVVLGIVVTFAPSAWAGGGGAKTAATIEIVNECTDPDYYNAALGIDLPDKPYPTLADFLRAGGKVIAPGQSTTFRVKAGDHVVICGFGGNTWEWPPDPEYIGQLSVTVSSSKLKLRVYINTSGVVVIEPAP